MFGSSGIGRRMVLPFIGIYKRTGPGQQLAHPGKIFRRFVQAFAERGPVLGGQKDLVAFLLGHDPLGNRDHAVQDELSDIGIRQLGSPHDDLLSLRVRADIDSCCSGHIAPHPLVGQATGIAGVYGDSIVRKRYTMEG